MTDAPSMTLDQQRALARARARIRMGGGQTGGGPIRAQGPDGQLFEFPQGTQEEVISRAIREHYNGQQGGGQTGGGQMQRIRTPDGYANFPADMSDADIERVLQREYPPTGGATQRPPRVVRFEGQTHQFPADATDAEIRDALSQPSGAQGSGQMSPQDEIELLRIRARARARAAAASEQARRDPNGHRTIAGLIAGDGGALPPTTDRREAVSALNAFNRGIPFMRDFQRGLRGVMEAAPEVLDTQPGDYLGRIGGAFGHGVQRANQDFQTLDADANARHPLGNQLAQGAGGALPVAMTAGFAAPETAAANIATTPERLALQHAARLRPVARGAGAFLRQTAIGGATGAAYGDVYGVGTSDGDWQQRLQAGNEGMGAGLVFGALTPTAVNAGGAVLDRIGRPAWEALSGVARRLPVPMNPESSVGAMGRPMRNVTPPPRPPLPRRAPVIPRGAVNTLERLADRSGQSPEAINAEIARARAQGSGEVLADVFGDPAKRTVRAMVQAPGQTGARAAAVVRERFQAAPDRILNELNRRLQVTDSPESALRSLNQQYERVSAESYRPIFERPLTAEQRADLDRSLVVYHDDPVFTDALRRSQRIFSRDQREGLVKGSIDDNFARFAHYVKMGLDDAVAAAPVGSRGLGATEMRGVTAMRARVLAALDRNIPGYRDARAAWGGLREAEDALTEGRAFHNQSSGAIQARMAELTPFARYHARVGFADQLANRLGLRGSVNGNRNVAESVLGSPEMQRRVMAMFESPEEAAAFIESVNRQNRLMRNSAEWVGGSTTYSNFAHGDDNTLAGVLEVGGHAMKGNIPAAAASAAGHLRNFATLGAAEHANNQTGAVLLRRIDTQEAKRFTDAVIAELRRRAETRTARARASRVAATASGATAGRRRQ